LKAVVHRPAGWTGLAQLSLGSRMLKVLHALNAWRCMHASMRMHWYGWQVSAYTWQSAAGQHLVISQPFRYSQSCRSSKSRISAARLRMASCVRRCSWRMLVRSHMRAREVERWIQHMNHRHALQVLVATARCLGPGACSLHAGSLWMTSVTMSTNDKASITLARQSSVSADQ
jgi:hypothetical protein